MAIGVMSSTDAVILSPGITISTPSSRLTTRGYVSCSKIKLRTIAIKERGMTATLFLAEDITLGLELGMRSDRLRCGQNLPAFDLLALNAAQQGADIIAGLTFVKKFPEHLNTGTGGLGSRSDTDYLNLIANMNHAALNPAGGNSTTSGDGEYIFHRHQKRLIDIAFRLRDIGVDGIHQLPDTFRRLQGLRDFPKPSAPNP